MSTGQPDQVGVSVVVEQQGEVAEAVVALGGVAELRSPGDDKEEVALIEAELDKFGGSGIQVPTKDNGAAGEKAVEPGDVPIPLATEGLEFSILSLRHSMMIAIWSWIKL